MNLTAFTLHPQQAAGYSTLATSALLELDGVNKLMLNASSQICSVSYDVQKISPMELLAALAKAGFASEVQLPAAEARQSCCGGCS